MPDRRNDSDSHSPWPDRVARTFLLLLALGSALVLLRSLVHYDWDSHSARKIVLYFAAPGAACLVFVRASRARRTLRTRMALALGAAAAALVGVEWFLARGELTPERAILNSRLALAREAGVEFDSRTPFQFLKDARADGQDMWPFISPLSMTSPDALGARHPQLASAGEPVLPLAGISGRCTLNGNEFGRFVTYLSDEHGFNNPPGLWGAEPTDLLVLGDSFVQGYAIEREDSFVSLVRHLYPSCLNLGTSGSGPLVQLAALVEYASVRRPRTVVWCYFEGNDLDDFAMECEAPLLLSYLEDGFRQGLIARQAEIDDLLVEAINTFMARVNPGAASRPGVSVRSLVTLKRLRARLGITGRHPSSGGDPPGAFEDVLRRAHTLVESWGGSLLFVYLPAWERFARPWEPAAKRHRVLEAARSAGMQTLDLTLAFESHGDPLSFFPFQRWGHYNEAGHRLVADTLVDALTNAELDDSSR